VKGKDAPGCGDLNWGPAKNRKRGQEWRVKGG